ncbi:MAG: calcium/sodium antiporter [Candidatus Cloacimonetes bacterium]|nr:calcium/sodium antiporter [Candidatus Cloacimonadota bacterium]
MILQTLLLVFGFLLLIIGAQYFVEGSSSLARKYNVSNLVIGLTLVAFGTSAPELVVNTFASFQKHQDIVFGNIIGSNNFNIFIILGITGLITPLVVQSQTVWKEIPISIFAVLTLYFLSNELFFSNLRILTRLDGIILLIIFVFFLVYIFRQMKADQKEPKLAAVVLSKIQIWTFILAGITGLILGGKLVVDNAVKLAINFGFSEKIIGITIIAAGTSLPELATSVTAAIKKNMDIAVGNIIGSNIFNIFFVLGISSLIRPMSYRKEFNSDLYVLACGTVLLFIAMFTGEKKKLDRWEAGILLLLYIGYSIYIVYQEL